MDPKKERPNEKSSSHKSLFFDVLKNKNIINLGIGEPGFDTPKEIKDAAIEHILNKSNGYPHPKGNENLREKVVEKLSYKNKISSSPEEVLITNGGKMGVYLAINTLVKPGDEVLVPYPTWDPFISIVRGAGGIPVPYDFSIGSDITSIEQKITKRTSAVILNSPNNPSGKVIQKNEISEFTDIISKSNATLISDEAYETIVFDSNKHFSPGSIIPEKTVSIYSLAKNHCMTGWRAGYLSGPRELVNSMETLQTDITTGVSPFVQSAIYAALEEPQSSVKKRIDHYERNRELICSRLSKQFSFKKPQGTFYLFTDVSKIEVNGTKFFQNIAERGVTCIPGFLFGKDYEKYVRFTFATDSKKLKKAVDIINECVG